MSNSVRAAAKPVPAAFTDENAVHYGVLMGGPKEIKWNGIGSFSISHQSIPRRALAEFTQMLVGRRNDTEDALNDDSARLHQDWDKNPARIVSKSPRAQVNEVYQTFGYRGWCIPESLIGMPYTQASVLFEKVMPASVAAKPLNDVIAHLSQAFETDSPEARLRDELLNSAFTAKEWLSAYVRAVGEERERGLKSGVGKVKLDPVDEEYYRELGTPLPEEVPALATLSMGKEIAIALGDKGRHNDTKRESLLEELLAQNRILIDRLTTTVPENKTEAAAAKAVDNNKGK